MAVTELLPLKEGAQELKLSIHTLRGWIYHKKLSYLKLGRRTLPRREDVETLIAKSLVMPREKK